MLGFFHLTAKAVYQFTYVIKRMVCFSRRIVYPFIQLVGKLFDITRKVVGNAAHLCRKLFFGALNFCIQIIDSLLHQFKSLVAFHAEIFIVRGVFGTDSFDSPLRRSGKISDLLVYRSPHLCQLLIDASFPSFKIVFSRVELPA